MSEERQVVSLKVPGDYSGRRNSPIYTQLVEQNIELKQDATSLRTEIASIIGGLKMLQGGLENGSIDVYKATEFLQIIIETKEHLTEQGEHGT